MPASSNAAEPLISAVINYYNPKAISRIEATVTLCLEALKEFSANPVEVICSDGSGVESPTIKTVCQRLGLVYTLSPVPQNYAAIYNHGMRLARGQYICVLENDVFVHKDWDAKMLAEMKRTGASLAVPYLTSCDMIIQQNGFVLRRRTFEPSCISQNLMLFDREAYSIAFPMDEQFNGAYNDNDTYLRLRAAGKRMIVCSAGIIVHYRRSSQIYHSFSYESDTKKFQAKYPRLKWNKYGTYSLADPLFIRSRPYRWLMALAGGIPSNRWAEFVGYHLQRFEPLFQGI
jgi:GT2 family glycosyltransferase